MPPVPTYHPRMDLSFGNERLGAAILANPADPEPCLVFADWLEEQGQPIWATGYRLLGGVCADEPGPLEYYVGNLEFGYVHALVKDITLDDFALGEHGIVVQKALDDDTVVSCGWIPDYTAEP